MAARTPARAAGSAREPLEDHHGELAPHLQQIAGEGLVVGVALPQVGERGDEVEATDAAVVLDDVAAALAHREQAAGGELGEGRAHGHPVHAEALGEAALGREALAGREVAAEDGEAKRVGAGVDGALGVRGDGGELDHGPQDILVGPICKQKDRTPITRRARGRPTRRPRCARADPAGPRGPARRLAEP